MGWGSSLNGGATYLPGPASTERLVAAAAWFGRGIALAPRYPELHYYLGLTRFRQRRWVDASRSLRQAVALCHRGTRLHFGLGSASRADRVEVRRPNGVGTRLQNVVLDRLLTLRLPATRAGDR